MRIDPSHIDYDFKRTANRAGHTLRTNCLLKHTWLLKETNTAARELEGRKKKIVDDGRRSTRQGKAEKEI